VRGLDGIATVFRRGVERVTFTRVGIVDVCYRAERRAANF
jgi:hypothetical protein